MVDAADRELDHRDVQRVELVAVLLKIEVRRLAVRADDDVARPGSEVERHRDRLSSRADDDDFLVDALAAVAVGADGRRVAVHAVEAWYVGPDVLQADREEQTARANHVATLEGQLEGILVVTHDSFAEGIAKLDAPPACFVATGAAK